MPLNNRERHTEATPSAWGHKIEMINDNEFKLEYTMKQNPFVRGECEHPVKRFMTFKQIKRFCHKNGVKFIYSGS